MCAGLKTPLPPQFYFKYNEPENKNICEKKSLFLFNKSKLNTASKMEKNHIGMSEIKLFKLRWEKRTITFFFYCSSTLEGEQNAPRTGPWGARVQQAEPLTVCVIQS